MAKQFNRIILALSASADRMPVMEIGANLAAEMQGRLIGLFVEDINLINLAHLPFAQEISLSSRRKRSLDPDTVQRELDETAQTARRELAQIAGNFNIPWEFEKIRGEFDKALSSFAKADDLLVVGEEENDVDIESLRLSGRIITRQIACRASLLVKQRPIVQEGPIVLVIEGHQSEKRDIGYAFDIAQSRNRPLQIFMFTQNQGVVDTVKKSLESEINFNLPPLLRTFAEFDPTVLLEALDRAKPSMIMICADTSDEAVAGRIRQIIPHIDVPILFLSNQPEEN